MQYTEQYMEILGAKIHYIEQGAGDPILFLQGIPTSCYVWSKIFPFLAPLGNCIAPDLIGVGKSDKPDITYTLEEHICYIEKFIEAKKLKNITLVMHGWGSLIGLHYALRHENNCKGLVFYEAFLRPVKDNDFSLLFQEEAASTEKSGEKILAQYWKELPKGDGKSKGDHFLEEYAKKLSQSLLPKLLLYSVPGFITTIATVVWAKEHLPNLELGDVGEELHFAQEVHPQLMGELISAWLQAVEQQQKSETL